MSGERERRLARGRDSIIESAKTWVKQLKTREQTCFVSPTQAEIGKERVIGSAQLTKDTGIRSTLSLSPCSFPSSLARSKTDKVAPSLSFQLPIACA